MKGAPDQLNGLFVDITDQKAAETEAELQRQEVTHLMRVSVMGELSGAITHEVNQPLTAILTNAQSALYMLEQETLNRGQMRDTLLDIVSEDKRAGEVVQRVRALLKKGESRSEAVDINELVELDHGAASQRVAPSANRDRERPCRKPLRGVGRFRATAASTTKSGRECNGCNVDDARAAATHHNPHPRDASRRHPGAG